jgi:S-adenosylmethionine-dependent methyltransferase
VSAATARVRRFYDRTVAHEAQRLDENVYRRLERDVTLSLIERHVPAHARILDVGGGPGAYLEPLVRRGYQPWLCDLSRANVRQARVRAAALGLPAERVRQADACDLSAYADAAFDAALVAGPFYHLTDGDAQRRALGELCRVVRPGGVLVCSILPRLHPLRYLLREASEASWRCLARVDWDRFLADGRWANPGGDPLFFTDAQMLRPRQFRALLAGAGCRVVDVAAAEGFCAFGDVPLAAWVTSEARYRRLLALVEKTARDPDALGAAEHLLVVARTARRKKV